MATRTPFTLSSQAKQELFNMLSFLSYGKTRLSRIYTYWCMKGPSLEDGAGLTAMILEESGHASILNQLVKEVNSDKLFAKPVIPQLEGFPQTWTELILTIVVYDRFFYEIFQSASSSEYEPLAKNMKKIVEEEKFHAEFGSEWAYLLTNSPHFKDDFFRKLDQTLDFLQELAEQIPSKNMVGEKILNKGIDEILSTFKRHLLLELSQ